MRFATYGGATEVFRGLEIVKEDQNKRVLVFISYT